MYLMYTYFEQYILFKFVYTNMFKSMRSIFFFFDKFFFLEKFSGQRRSEDNFYGKFVIKIHEKWMT